MGGFELPVEGDGTRLELVVGYPAAVVLGNRGGEAFLVSLVQGLGLADEGLEVQRRELGMGNGYDLLGHRLIDFTRALSETPIIRGSEFFK
jgi:hypothetical protein